MSPTLIFRRCLIRDLDSEAWRPEVVLHAGSVRSGIPRVEARLPQVDPEKVFVVAS